MAHDNSPDPKPFNLDQQSVGRVAALTPPDQTVEDSSPWDSVSLGFLQLSQEPEAEPLPTTTGTTAPASPDAAVAESDYILKEIIGRGGQGEVWSAWQRSLDREVVVKVHKRGATTSFLREAWLTAELDHPNIAPVHAIGKVRLDSGKDDLAMVMKRVRGKRWDELLRNDHQANEIDYVELLNRHLPILISVCNAVAYAHSKKLLHLDLKPSQVIVGEFGEVVLMDWGLAMTTEENPPSAPDAGIPKYRTRNDEIGPVGTPAFMSPEQTGKLEAPFTVQTDIFLLGASAWTIIGGKAPFIAATPGEMLEKAKRSFCPELPYQCPAELKEIIEWSMASDPADRPASVEAFRDRLQEFYQRMGQQRESQRLTHEFEEWWQRQEQVHSYTDWEEHERTLQKALVLWPENVSAQHLLQQVMEQHAYLALEHGDLELARNKATALHSEQHRRLMDEIENAQQLRARKERQRRRAVVITYGLIIAIFALGTYSYNELTDLYLESEQARNQAEQALNKSEYEFYLSLIQAAKGNLVEQQAEKARQLLLDTPAQFRGWEWGYLLSEAYPERVILQKSPGAIVASAVSRDETMITTGDDRGWLRISDSRTGALLQKERPYGKNAIVGVAFGSNGVISAGMNGHVAFTDFARSQAITRQISNYPLTHLVGHPTQPNTFYVSDDNAELFTCKVLDNKLEVVHTQSFGEKRASISHLSIAGPDDVLAVGFSDGTLQMWQETTRLPLDQPTPFTARVQTVAFHPTSPLVAVSAFDPTLLQPVDDPTVRVWNYRSGKLAYEIQPTNFANTSITFSNDGDWLFLANGETSVSRYYAASGKFDIKTYDDQGIVRNILAVDDINQKSDPKPRTVEATSQFLTVRGTYMQPLRETRGHLNNITQLSFLPKRNLIFSADEEGHASLWKLFPEHDFEFQRTGEGRLMFAEVATKGPRLMLASKHGHFMLFDRSNIEPETIDSKWDQFEPKLVEMNAAGDAIYMVSVDDELHRWIPGYDLKLLADLSDFSPTAMALSPDESTIYLGTPDAQLVQYHIAERSFSFRRPFETSSAISSFCWLPDGVTLIAGTKAGELFSFNTGQGDVVRLDSFHAEEITSLEVSATTNLLAAASLDWTVSLYDATTLEPEHHFNRSHTGGVTDLTFSPDGQRLVTTSHDSFVRIFDPTHRREVIAMREHKYGALSVGFDPTLSLLFTLGRDGKLRIWFPIDWSAPGWASTPGKSFVNSHLGRRFKQLP
jgi:serine/threonine protein kinase/WD40 repeat protein